MPDEQQPLRQERTYLVAVVVDAASEHSRAEVERALHPFLPAPHTRLVGVDDAVIDSWWVAEDDRQDRSDNDSAMFVPYRGPRESRSALTQVEREELIQEFDEIGSFISDRVEQIIAARYQP